MSGKTSIDTKPSDVFKTYPEFSKLALVDRKKYEKAIEEFPPLAELAFPTLMIWWNSLDSCAVSTLNGNLIVSYWLPGVERHSGLSMIGTNKVEETMCTMFDHMRAQGEKPRLVHMPEFVIAEIEHPDLFVCKSERDYDEYIYRLSSFQPLKNLNGFRRARVKRFLARTEGNSVVVRSLDLNDEENLKLLKWCIHGWHKTGHINDSFEIEVDAINIALRDHDMLGMENLCLFVDGELHGFCLFHRSKDKRYVTITNARMNTKIPSTLDYAIFVFTQRMADEGAVFLNLECDLGSKFMRMFKLSLGPIDFFRKYTIEPADG